MSVTRTTPVRWLVGGISLRRAPWYLPLVAMLLVGVGCAFIWSSTTSAHMALR